MSLLLAQKKPVQKSVFEKTSAEKSILKSAKKKHIAHNRQLNPSFDKKNVKWLSTNDMKQIGKLVQMAQAVQVAAA